MSLVGVITTVSVYESGGNLVLTIPSRVVADLLINRGDHMICRVTGKDIKYRKVE